MESSLKDDDDKDNIRMQRSKVFSVDLKKIKQAVIDLDREFLTIEATGDYARANAMMLKYVVIRPEVQKALDKMKVVPNDIRPDFVTARNLTKGMH